jgi:hypothetical protein
MASPIVVAGLALFDVLALLWLLRALRRRRRARIDGVLHRLDGRGRFNTAWRLVDPETGSTFALDGRVVRSALEAERAKRGAGRSMIKTMLATRPPASGARNVRPIESLVAISRPREHRPGRRRRAVSRTGPDDDSDSDGEGPPVAPRRRGGPA